MNYVWDLIINAKNSNINKNNIHFSLAHRYSPYMELSNDYINFKKVKKNIEINPYYRFYEIFMNLFDVNDNEYEELKNTFFDILVHFLSEIDINQGMNKREYYMKFMLSDIINKAFGNSLSQKIKFFENEERDILISNMLRLYETGQMIYLLIDTVKRIFKNAIIYTNIEDKDEILFYFNEKKNISSIKKFEFIAEVFIPVNFEYTVFWNSHFGVLGIDETLKIDDIELY